MAGTEETLVSMRMGRRQFTYCRFTFSYQCFLFQQMVFSYEKEVVPAEGGGRGYLSHFSLRYRLFPAFDSEPHLGLRNMI